MLRARKARVIPFGWKRTEDDPDILETIPEEYEALEVAAWYFDNGYTLKTISEWLLKKTGRYISCAGLLKAFLNVRRRNPSTKEIEATNC